MDGSKDRMNYDASNIFSDIYRNDKWTNGSGPGSIASLNSVFLEYLRKFIDDNQINSIADIGCGDFQLLRNFPLGTCNYIGFDVVPSIIEKNRRTWANNSTAFSNMPTNLDDLPNKDLYIIKDVLIHLPNSLSKEILEAILKRCKFAIIVNNNSSDTDNFNSDISPGQFRPVDVSLDPFNFKVMDTILYGQACYYDPKWPKFLAILLRKRVWPGEKHIQILVGGR